MSASPSSSRFANRNSVQSPPPAASIIRAGGQAQNTHTHTHTGMPANLSQDVAANLRKGQDERKLSWNDVKERERDTHTHTHSRARFTHLLLHSPAQLEHSLSFHFLPGKMAYTTSWIRGRLRRNRTAIKVQSTVVTNGSGTSPKVAPRAMHRASSWGPVPSCSLTPETRVEE